ncbi:unnamed protein product [Prorocentrum cordatum]|uniref:Uncharacterized protein n=1 Tax=Prorocentrum cordatum TaxID=2364126 RepID=A0ABN9UP62_9DINO|nr:unnamed protein product [Polarella glacialis]
MKMAVAAILCVASSMTLASASAEQVNPIGKVLEMLSDLQAKVIKEGEGSQKVYEEFSEWCEESNKRLAFEIKTGKAEAKELEAVISEETALIESLTTKAEDLAQKISVDETDLEQAAHIRSAEAAAFAAEKSELDDIIDTLSRAIGILQKHASAALLQSTGTTHLVEALNVMVQKLTALVQQSEDSEGDNEGAPSASVYEGHSGGILDVLQDLLDKANLKLPLFVEA